MPDYGHSLEFGFFLDPGTGTPEHTLATGRLLDELGFDLIGIQDHPYQARHYDAMTLIGSVLAQTERVRVFPDVANLPLRLPAMLAKQVATLDQLSGGRFELGLGAGAFWEGIRAMGGSERSPGEALTALREATEILRAYWRGGAVRVEGQLYQVVGARPGPQPAHEIGIWYGVVGPKALALTGELADGWVPSMSYVPPGRARVASDFIDAAARDARRQPTDVRRIYNLGGRVTESETVPFTDDSTEIVGPVSHWIESLARLAIEQGFSSFILWGDPEPVRLRLFIDEIAPGVRERVDASR